jgi:hypothetical protein
MVVAAAAAVLRPRSAAELGVEDDEGPVEVELLRIALAGRVHDRRQPAQEVVEVARGVVAVGGVGVVSAPARGLVEADVGHADVSGRLGRVREQVACRVQAHARDVEAALIAAGQPLGRNEQRAVHHRRDRVHVADRVDREG